MLRVSAKSGHNIIDSFALVVREALRERLTYSVF
jgi:hypothetical protein